MAKGPNVYPGAKMVIKPNGDRVDLRYNQQKIKLMPGFKVVITSFYDCIAALTLCGILMINCAGGERSSRRRSGRLQPPTIVAQNVDDGTQSEGVTAYNISSESQVRCKN